MNYLFINYGNRWGKKSGGEGKEEGRSQTRGKDSQFSTYYSSSSSSSIMIYLVPIAELYLMILRPPGCMSAAVCSNFHGRLGANNISVWYWHSSMELFISSEVSNAKYSGLVQHIANMPYLTTICDVVQSSRCWNMLARRDFVWKSWTDSVLDISQQELEA